MQETAGTLISSDESVPAALAKMFCNLTSEKQAEFFNSVAVISSTWEASAALQWRYMQSDLSEKGSRLIEEIYEHTRPA